MNPRRTQVQDDDDEIIAAAREGFLDEATQMLQQFEDALLALESSPDDAELLNAAFRAAHTIKGTAGLFGCDAVVAFTHEVETVMEALRSGTLAVDEAGMALLLKSRDQMGRLLAEVASGVQDAEVAAESLSLAAALRGLLTPDDAPAQDESPAATATGAAAAQAAAAAPAAATAADGLWQISLRFGLDALRNGLDPLAFLRYLDQVGTVQGLLALGDRVPTLDELDAEACHVAVEIALQTEADRAAIEQVFEFVLDDCDLALFAPGSAWAERAARLDSACRDEAERGQVLAWMAQCGLPTGDEPATSGAATQLPDGRHAALEAELIDHVPAAASAPAAAHPTTTPTATAPGATRPLTATAAERRQDEAGDRRVVARRQDDARFIRVRADKLDHLIDLIGELVTASSGAQLVAQQEASERFGEAAQRIGDLVEQARDGALGLRMVPIGETFSRFQRVVRDVSKALGKEVDLQISGGDTELDKTMVETIADPIMHLVRNSLDHGIEGAEDRVAAGKSPRGRLALHAFHEQGQIFIEVSDDGRGLKRERILAKAIERGLVNPEAELSDHEVHQLICLPGFSTAEKVTDISGRGVGMDVVKRNIESLRGQFQIASIEGRGSTMQIRLPLTLAIIDGFLTQVADVHYIVPLEMVVECVELPAGASAQAGSSGYVDLRGEVLPYLDLRLHFGIEAPRPRRASLLVVSSNGMKCGLLVDRLHGKYQTVIKPLGSLLRHLRCVAGSTVLGSGEVGLVLDLPALLAGVRRAPAHALGAAATLTIPATAAATPGPAAFASPAHA